MKRCPGCLRTYADDLAYCDADGAALDALDVVTLADLAHATPPVAIARAVRLVAALADAVEALDRDGRRVAYVHPLDAEVAGRDAPVERVLVTLADDADPDRGGGYRAPEALTGSAATAASRVYNLGVIAYELLTGVRPFEGATVAAVAVRQMLERPRPLRDHRPEVPPSVEALVLRALDRDPALRPATPADLAAALRSAPSDLPAAPAAVPSAPAPPAPSRAPGAGSVPTTARPRGAWPWVPLVAGALALAAAGVAWRSLRGNPGQPTQPAPPDQSAQPAQPPWQQPGQAPPAPTPVVGAPPPVMAAPAPSSAHVPAFSHRTSGRSRAAAGVAPGAPTLGTVGSAGHGPGALQPPVRPPPAATVQPPPAATVQPPPAAEVASAPPEGTAHVAGPAPAVPSPSHVSDRSARTSLGVGLLGVSTLLLAAAALAARMLRGRPRRASAAVAPLPTLVSVPPTLVTPRDSGSFGASARGDGAVVGTEVTVASGPSAGAPRCPVCGAVAPGGATFCPHDGARLTLAGPSSVPASVPSGYRGDGDGEVEAFQVGQYLCVARLGEGGMGVVYRARHVHLDRPAAVKVLLAAGARHDDAAALFRREARLAATINHPNSVTIYDYGEVGASMFYLAMEFLDGSTLADVIRAEPLPWTRALAVVRQVCDGLDAAHSAGIVHRDLKPQNLMVCPRPSRPDLVKIVDFGIARAVARGDGGRTLGGMVVGTPAYMAPEQARGEPDVDARADVFSLGVVTYQMLTGRLPFAGDGLTAMQQIVRRATTDERPAPLSTARAGLRLPPGVDEALARAMAFDRAQRPAGALAFAGELAASAG